MVQAKIRYEEGSYEVKQFTPGDIHINCLPPRARLTRAKSPRVPECSATGAMMNTGECLTTGTGRTKQLTDTES